MHKAISLAVTLAVAALLIIGCSGGGSNPTVPLDDGASITPEPEGGSQRFLLGVFEIDIDAAASQLTIEPVRNASAHYDVTDYITPPQCDDCLEIEVLEFKPIDHYVKLKISIRNPTHFTVYDVRGIMISNFEGMHLLNADSYTDLWDDGGDVTINPFRAFATDWPYREILPDTGHARIYEIEYPTLGDLINTLLVFDASWPGNCREPYEITNFTQEEIFDQAGSSGEIRIDVLDWQGDVSTVAISIPEITGVDITQLTHQFGDTWGVTLVNNTGAFKGNYTTKITATSTGSGETTLYDFVSVVITEYNIEFNPVDVTPPWLNYRPNDIYVEGNFAFIAGDKFGLHSYDISDPWNPSWVYRIDTPHSAYRAAVSDGYAYIGSIQSVGPKPRFAIIDIDPPESAYLVNILETPEPVYDFAISGGYAYIPSDDLIIADIDPPESAHIVNTVDVFYTGLVAVSEGYAYASGVNEDYQLVLHIIDINPPEEANVVNTVPLPNPSSYSYNLEVSNGYVYMPNGTYGLEIVDVDPPVDAHHVKTVATPGLARYVGLWNNAAFIADGDNGVQVIDITTPETASLENNIDFPASVYSVTVTDGYAYVKYLGGISIVDVEPFDSPEVLSTIFSEWDTMDAAWSDGHLYCWDYYSGFISIHDGSQPEFLKILNTVPEHCCTAHIEAFGDYAYLMERYGDEFHIVKVNPPGSAHIVYSLEFPSTASHFKIAGDYAYAACGAAGLKIICINPPEFSYVVATVDTPGWGRDVAIWGDRAYVADGPDGLAIIDISDPEAAYIVIQIPSGNIGLVDVADGYAYVCGHFGLSILDVEPPEDAHIVRYVPDLKNSRDIDVEGGYAYLARNDNGLSIVDIDPPEEAYIVANYNTQGDAASVSVANEYAYLVDEQYGLRVIKLW